jgi:hypothetical protein
MLNKKDPLIESVQKIMLENEIRRTVTKNLNEELGIQSINNLPHELHEKYTAILEQNITAALLDEKVQMTKQQFANLDGKPEFTGRDLELARAGHHKKLAAAGKLEELTTDPYAEKDAGHDVVTTVPKPKPEITPADQKQLGDKIKSIKEEQFDENWGDKPPKSEREGYSKDPEDGKWKPTHKIGKKLKQNTSSTKKYSEKQLGEEITGKTDIGDAIKDFRASKSKQLAGRSSEERRKAAIAAVLQARREKK